MIQRMTFLDSLSPLKDFITSDSPQRTAVFEKAAAANPWFISEFTDHAIHAIADEFLDPQKCERWLATYAKPEGSPKNIALIMAGNVPMVGFHDLFCVLASGHTAVIKLSDKDPVLLPWIISEWLKINPDIAERIQLTEKLQHFDAAIATGSNNSARYFEYYFRAYPHILRQNRNGVSVLTGDESSEELKLLAKDIFLFFGLGCRNVSKIFVPEGYDFEPWNQAIEDWAYLGDHNKYKNNLDYNYAIYIINGVPHINLGHLILKEDASIASRIGCVHYSFYSDTITLEDELNQKSNEVQCVISQKPLKNWEHVGFGQSQVPRLDQFADGVDTMQFLTGL